MELIKERDGNSRIIQQDEEVIGNVFENPSLINK